MGNFIERDSVSEKVEKMNAKMAGFSYAARGDERAVLGLVTGQPDLMEVRKPRRSKEYPARKPFFS